MFSEAGTRFSLSAVGILFYYATMDFVIIANGWGAASDNPTGKHQIARELAKKGHRILWIEGAGMRRPATGSHSDRSRIKGKIRAAMRGIEQAEPNIWKVAPLIIPLPGIGVFRAINGLIYSGVALFAKLALRFKRPILINFLPIVPLAERVWPWMKVYFCVDRWDKFEMYDSAVMGRCDRACCLNADKVLTTSIDLQVRCQSKGVDSTLIGHGVNWQHFHGPLLDKGLKRPSDLPDGKIIGFFGLISEWVNQDLLIEMIRQIKSDNEVGEYSELVLIGRADVDITRLEQEPGITLLGSKLFEELPRYTAYFDVAIIPFEINELTIAVNPIKLREMLAAGCPVVATDLPEVEQISHTNKYTRIARDAEGFIVLVKEMLQLSLSQQDRLDISESVVNETWSAKVNLILKAIEGS